ncbi:MAG: hypothetical protein AAF823_00215 [Planctomycetota bacterium]
MNDRRIMVACVAVALAGLVGSAGMFPAINQQRRELQLSTDLEVGDRVPPEVALTAAALGSFKGIAVNYMWYRIEMLKRDGKFYEAGTLADWITTLQPRFPQVWSFHAWNMAYNISVETHTPQERYDWVMKGVNLLRQKGIPLNPNATRLYREVAWIYFHKIGQFADDQHWYYKRREARHWQELLGAPSEGLQTQQIIDRFQLVADASERYFQFERMPAEARLRLIDLAIELENEGRQADARMLRDIAILPLSRSGEALEAHLSDLEQTDPALANRIRFLPDMPARFRALAQELADEDRPEAAALVREIAGQLPEGQARQLDFAMAVLRSRQMLGGDMPPRVRRLFGSGPFTMPPLERTQQQIDRQLDDALSMLYDDTPEARNVIEQLRSIGYGLDEDTLRQIGEIIMFGRYMPEAAVMAFIERERELQALKLAELLANPEHREGLTAVIAYLRAKVLLENYTMDPSIMLSLMNGQALRGPDNPDTPDTDESVPTPMPLDWRHPATHAMYWSYVGVVKAGELNNDERIDYLNTYRQIIHGIQSLSRYGRVSYNPITDQLDNLPDPRFFDAYEKAALNARFFTEQADIDHAQGTIETYESGHENLLAKAAVVTYLYGSVDKAQGYYDRVRDLYGDKPHNFRSGRYTFPLQEFVFFELAADGDMQAVSRAFIDAMINQALIRGLRVGRFDIYNRFLTLARMAHERYQSASNKIEDANSIQDRMRFLPFPEVVREGYAGVIRSRNLDLLQRQRIYANTPVPMREQVYPRFHLAIVEEVQQLGFRPDVLFPPPPGFDESQLEVVPNAAESAETVERN